ncbi:MAG: putative regulatory protein, FmdB family [Deltaproteobacteria bacterium]|nr:putative regulatory protein, FmdB family [Deltaproteobacteria bacterium]
MPIYEYQCTECGKTFEIFQKISDEPLSQCKVCNGRLNKLISNCAFHLKGTGWYVTDYKKPVDSASGGARNGSKSVETTESTPAPATEAKTETKTESATSTSTTTGGAA